MNLLNLIAICGINKRMYFSTLSADYRVPRATVELGIPDPCLHGRVVLIDPLHFLCRIHPPHDDADGPVGGGAA